MTTILDQHATGDGWDVRFVTAGEAHTLHFSSQPTEDERDAAIAAFEKRLLDEIAAKHNLEVA